MLKKLYKQNKTKDKKGIIYQRSIFWTHRQVRCSKMNTPSSAVLHRLIWICFTNLLQDKHIFINSYQISSKWGYILLTLNRSSLSPFSIHIVKGMWHPCYRMVLLISRLSSGLHSWGYEEMANFFSFCAHFLEPVICILLLVALNPKFFILSLRLLTVDYFIRILHRLDILRSHFSSQWAGVDEGNFYTKVVNVVFPKR